MIDLKRDDKGNLKNATGLNSQKWRCYKPGQEKDFPVSRSRFEDFSKCPPCLLNRACSRNRDTRVCMHYVQPVLS